MTNQDPGFTVGGYHPLFLPEPGQTEEDYPPKWPGLIEVRKFLPNGKRLTVPGTLRPDDVCGSGDPSQAVSQLRMRLGPGEFELVARAANGQIMAKRTYNFADESAPPQMIPGAPPVPGQPMMPAGDGSLMLLVLQMMQENRKEQAMMFQAMLQQQNATHAQTTQLMIAAMGARQGGDPVMAGLVGKMLDRPASSPADAVRAAKDVMDLAKNLAPETDTSQILQLVAGIVAGAMQAKQAQDAARQQQAVPVAPTVVDVPPPQGNPNQGQGGQG